MPLAGEEKTTLSDAPEIPFYAPGTAPCYLIHPAHTHTDSSGAHEEISSAKFTLILLYCYDYTLCGMTSVNFPCGSHMALSVS